MKVLTTAASLLIAFTSMTSMTSAAPNRQPIKSVELRIAWADPRDSDHSVNELIPIPLEETNRTEDIPGLLREGLFEFGIPMLVSHSSFTSRHDGVICHFVRSEQDGRLTKLRRLPFQSTKYPLLADGIYCALSERRNIVFTDE